MMGFFRAVRREIEEAAWLDGCGVVGGLSRDRVAALPAGIATTAIFAGACRSRNILRGGLTLCPWTKRSHGGLPTMLIRGDVFFWAP